MNNVWEEIGESVPDEAKEIVSEVSEFEQILDRLKNFVALINEGDDWFKDKTVLDIGGGNFLETDGQTRDFPLFYPWVCLIVKFLGAKEAKVVDLYDESVIDKDATSGLYDFFMKYIQMVDFNVLSLKDGFEPIPTVEPESIDFINCNQLVSAKKSATTSPLLRDELDVLRAVEKDSNPNAKLILKILNVAKRNLKEGGYLLFNNEVYRKLGDRIVWIGSIFYTPEKKQLWQELVGKEAIDEHGRPIPNGTTKVLGEGRLMVSKGVWKDLGSYSTPFEPIP